jgi:pimeloyl-ACP methyl ester carboxylesterase
VSSFRRWLLLAATVLLTDVALTGAAADTNAAADTSVAADTNAAANPPAGPIAPTSRADATRTVADMRHIMSPQGVERLEKVSIGGIDQWISIRGLDRRNPVLLMLHGGPGYVSMPLSWFKVTRLECPLILFSGRHDYNVSSEVGAEWFEKVRAPSKRLVWFENSAHEVMDEEPGKVLVSLVQYARPIAERAGDVP